MKSGLGIAIAAIAFGVAGLGLYWWTRPVSLPPVAAPASGPVPAPVARRATVVLPEPAKLLKRAKALAALDLILSPEWQDRYYSFNSQWAPGETMAQMRDGSGDEWWMVFSDKGWTAIKGTAIDSAARSEGGEPLAKTLQVKCSEPLPEFAKEPAFAWDSTGFCYLVLHPENTWTRVNDMTTFAGLDSGEKHLFRHLSGSAEEYVNYAREYFEVTVPVEIVRDIFDHKPVTPEIAARLNPEANFEEIKAELHGKIGYPQ